MVKIKKYLVILFFVTGLPAACPGLSPAAESTGGSFSVRVMASLSGGGNATGGALLVQAANIGGPTASGARLSGGNLALSGGATAAAVTVEAAKTDLGGVHCFPIPFKPSVGHAKITFSGLTRSARIKVFTLSGELVRTLDKSDAGSVLDWDARNSRGEALISGVYLYTVKSASQTMTGKLMIIR